MKISHCVLLSLFFVSLAGAACGEAVFVPFNGTKEFFVPDGETVTLTDRLTLAPLGRIDKTGEGTLVLPLTNFVQNADTEIYVRSGTLEIPRFGAYDAPAEDDYETVVKPILNKAAFWVKADVNTFSSDLTGTEYASDKVAAWYDCREDLSAATRTYPAAQCHWCSGDTAKKYYGVPPAKTTDHGYAAVSFGGYGNGQAMKWLKADNATVWDITGIRHAFIVTSIDETWGYPVMAYSGNADFHVTAGTAAAGNPYWVNYSGDGRAMYGARTYRDGVWIDAHAGTMTLGLQVLEVDFQQKTAHAGAFFTDRNISGRSGGDCLHEVLLFTNQLSTAEQLRVGQYLIGRYGLGREPGISVVTAPGATVFFDLPEGTTSAPPVRVSGAGRIAVAGGSLDTLALTNAHFTGTLELADGVKTRLKRNASVALQSAEADRFATERPNASSTTVVGSGEDVTRQISAGSSAALEGTGAGRIRLESIPAGVANVSVAGGLVLGAPVTDWVVEPSVRCATNYVQNGDFEENGDTSKSGFYKPVTASKNGTSGVGTDHGWTFQVDRPCSKADAFVGFFNREISSTKWPCAVVTPKNDYALMIKCFGYARTTVVVGESGDYRLSWYTNARYDSSSARDINVGWGADETHLTTVYSYSSVAKSPSYELKSVILTNVVAGTYCLQFRTDDTDVDQLTLFDEVALERIYPGDTTDSDVWKIPNGDFETLPDGETGFVLSKDIMPVGWTFAQAAFWSDVLDDTKYPAVSLVFPGAKPGAYTDVALWDSAQPTDGKFRLMMYGTGNVVRTTFTPPAGTYKFRCAFARRCGVYTYRKDVTTHNLDVRLNPTVNVRVKVGSGELTSLGSQTATGNWMKPTLWPTSFTVAEGESVTLELDQTSANGTWEPLTGENHGYIGTGMAILDDCVLVRMETDREEYLVNGGFEDSPSGWTLYDNKFTSYLDLGKAEIQNWKSKPSWCHQCYRTNSVDGTSSRLILTEVGAAEQNVAFEFPGAYRLSLFAYNRPTWGNCPLRAWIAKDGITNTVGYVFVDSHEEFREHSFVFRVPEAGTWRFGLQGDQWNLPQSMTDTKYHDASVLVDCVSVRPVHGALADVPDGLTPETAIVAGKTPLVLDFFGTGTVQSVRVGGRFLHGLINAKTRPDYVTGAGSLYVEPKHRGAILLFQ